MMMVGEVQWKEIAINILYYATIGAACKTLSTITLKSENTFLLKNSDCF